MHPLAELADVLQFYPAHFLIHLGHALKLIMLLKNASTCMHLANIELL